MRPGDLVVCVDAAPCPVFGVNGGLVKGAVYRVTVVKIVTCRRTGDTGTGLRLDRHNADPLWHSASRFRKIDPLADLDTRAAGKTFKLPAKPVIDPARHSREIAV